MKVKPQLLPNENPALIRTNGFTLGKEYRVIETHEPGKAVTVVNDRGHRRTVVPDGSPCAHITSVREGRFPVQRPIGCFVKVDE